MEGNTVDLIWLIWSLIYPSHKNWATVNSPVLFFLIGSSWVFYASGNLLPAWLGQTFYYLLLFLLSCHTFVLHVVCVYETWDLKHNLCRVNELQTPFNPETETFTHAWLCKLYFCMWIRRLQGVQPKNGFCKFHSLYYHDQKKACLCSFRKKVLLARFLFLNG